MSDNAILDLVQDIPYEHGFLGHIDIVEYSGQFLERDLGMDAAFILEEIMDHVEQVFAEFDKTVGGVGHDEELTHIFGRRFDLLRVEQTISPK